MMKFWITSFVALTFCSIAECQTLKTTLFVDFGPNDITNGNSTIATDANGKIWNNITNPGNTGATNLVDDKGISVSFSLSVSGSFSANGRQNGGLLSPSSSLLGEYAIPSATEDYFYTSTSGTIKISGLTPGNGYVFHLFGSRETSETRVTDYTLNGINSSSISLVTSGSGIGANSYNGNNNKIAVSDTIAPNANGEITLTVLRKTGAYAHINLLKVQEFVSPSKYPSTVSNIDPLKIVYFGSSVPYGQGASILSKGYTALYTALLDQRKIILGTKPWETVNICVPGDNTVKVLARYSSDFVPKKAKYVIYALALGNEGIHESGQPAFDQFKTNIQLLIQKAKDDGYVPVVTNSYTRNDYTSNDYSYIRQMNLFLAQLDVPSINLLGAVDDGNGHWANGYWYDGWHPNDSGHAELFYAMVPSLFDALDENKALPQKLTSSFVTLVKKQNESRGTSVEFKPENKVHSFTNTFSIKTSNKGIITELKEATGTGYLAINNDGKLQYTSSKTGSIIGSLSINDNAWHTITITHFYARGETVLYTDATLQGSLNEKLVIDKINIGVFGTVGNALVKDWLFYRSGMNADEIQALTNGNLLKSSLELYAPLDGKMTVTSDSLVNLAQSTNTLALGQIVLPLKLKSFSANSDKSGILLKWKTANEINFQGFIIERKTLFSEFANSTSLINSGKSDYYFTDKNVVPSETYYYRLKMLDKDGIYTFSDIIASKFLGFEQNDFSVYPNPFSKTLNVQINNQTRSSISISDLTGSILKVFNVNPGLNVLDLDGFANGVYVLKNLNDVPSNQTIIIKN